MQRAPLPTQEPIRLAKLRSLGVLDTSSQQAFDDITALAAATCGTPMALITLVDETRQWFKSRVGIESEETSREVAFCGHAILEPEVVMEVSDALSDPRFSDNPLVTAAPHIRFYAGAPMVTSDGFALGTVCVIDRVVRTLTDQQRSALKTLARMAVNLMERNHLAATSGVQAASQSELLVALTVAGQDLISYVDDGYVYRYVNHRYLTYWAKEESDIVGHSVPQLIGRDFFESTIKPQLDLALAGNTVTFDARLQFPGVGDRYLEITYIPMEGDDGRRGLVVRGHDINTIKLRKDELRRTVALLENKTLEQQRFIHIISHDLREPINTINNFSSLLAEHEALALDATSRRYLSFVHAGGKRMAMLLDDLLDFVRLDECSLTLKPVDLSAIAEHVREDLASSLGRTQGHVDIIGPLPAVNGDASLLRIALQNLVANGLKFARAGVPPLVTVRATTDPDAVHLHVRDNGIGMPSESLGSIFELFKRLHSRKQYEGTGLGLSICRRIAELHNGSISVTSTVGQGSCFTLTLPTHPTPALKDLDT